MRDATTLRIDLGINAQQIASQVMVDNRNLEEQIARGIQEALDEITTEKGFVSAVKEGTRKSLMASINTACNSWAVKDKISRALNEKLENKIEEYANGVADELFEKL